MIIDKALENELYDNGVYDAWQFVKNTYKILSIAEYSKNVIIDLISKMVKEHEEWKNSLFSQLLSQDSRVKAVSVSTDSLPAYKVMVASNEVVAPFLLGKLTNDFFQYTRNAFDSMSQIANVALLATKAKKADSVLLLNRREDGEIDAKNCEINKILVKKQNTNFDYIGEYVATEPFGDDTLLKYRKYKKESQKGLPIMFKVMYEWKKNPIYYKFNPFMDFTTVSDDNEFLARTQLPF